MGFHSDAVTGTEQAQFREWIEALRKGCCMSWGAIFHEAQISKALPGGQFHDGGAPGSQFQILQDAYRRKAIRPVFDAVQKLYNEKARIYDMGAQGRRLDENEVKGLRQLLKTLKARGNGIEGIAREIATGPSVLYNVVSGRAGASETTLNKVLAYTRKHITNAEELIAAALNGNGTPASVSAATPPAEAVDPPTHTVLGPRLQTEASATVPEPTVPESVAGPALTFSIIKDRLVAARDDIQTLCEGMPRVAQKAIQDNVLQYLEQAISEF